MGTVNTDDLAKQVDADIAEATKVAAESPKAKTIKVADKSFVSEVIEGTTVFQNCPKQGTVQVRASVPVSIDGQELRQYILHTMPSQETLTFTSAKPGSVEVRFFPEVKWTGYNDMGTAISNPPPANDELPGKELVRELIAEQPEE